MAEVGEIRVDIKTALKAMSTTEIADALSKSIESARRRELVGGLIRYLKDGETDLGRLLFHYVHIDDYGQAMIEGWGELHDLMTPPKTAMTGALGLPLAEVGEVVQAIVDREEFTKEQVIDMLRDFDESHWWDSYGGTILDQFEDWINLGSSDYEEEPDEACDPAD